MRMQTLMVVFLTLSAVICFSQESGMNEIHATNKSKNPVNNTPPAFSTLSDFFKSLSAAKTDAQRADIYYWISRYHADRLKIDSALFYSEKILEKNPQGASELALAKHYLSKAHALFYRNITGADLLQKAIAIFRKYKDHLFTGIAFRQWARNDNGNGDFAASRKNYHLAASYLGLTPDVKEVYWVNHELGRSFYYSYETDSAAFYLIRALEFAETLNDRSTIFNSSGILGELYLVTNDLFNAAKYLKYALDIRTPGMSKIIARSRLASYAECMMMLGEFDKAAVAANEYEEINSKLSDTWGNITSNKIKGAFQFHKKNYPDALNYLKLAYYSTNEIKIFSFDVMNIASYLGKAEYEMGYYDSAILHMKHVRDLASNIQFGADVMEANLLISQAHDKKGNRDSAYHYFRVYDKIKDSLFTFRKEKAIIELATKYESHKKEQQITLLEREKQLNVLQLRSKNDEIEKQMLLDQKKSQQLVLLSQQNEISRLESSEKTLAFANQQKEMLKKQNELQLLAKENELQVAMAAQETQRKNFAYMAIAGILVFSAFVLYRYNRSKKLSRRLAASLVDLKDAQEQLIKTEKEKESENIRVRISRDIHDEVGATLSGVALFSEIARQKMNQHDQKDAEVYLDHITANSKDMVEKMSDIVWTINPQNDSFDHIIAKLQSYAVNLCAGKGIKLHLEIDDRIRSYYPSMQVKRNIYMLLKEAINNAVKYSEGHNIYLMLQNKDDLMTLELRDDGKGFDKARNFEGNGLNNIKARANELGANLSIDSESGRGTSIRLQFYFHPAGGQRTVA